jgi:hypothetical protein
VVRHCPVENTFSKYHLQGQEEGKPSQVAFGQKAQLIEKVYMDRVKLHLQVALSVKFTSGECCFSTHIVHQMAISRRLIIKTTRSLQTIDSVYNKPLDLI